MSKMLIFFTILPVSWIPSDVFASGSADLLRSLPFETGISYVKGNYSFTNSNFLVEGAKRIAALGSPSIFIYMQSGYASDYPDKGQGLYGNPKTLTELASSPAYRPHHFANHLPHRRRLRQFVPCHRAWVRAIPAYSARSSFEQAPLLQDYPGVAETFRETRRLFPGCLPLDVPRP